MTEKTRIEELAAEWARAELEADTDTLDGILADDFIAIGPRGFMLTKEEWLERHTSGKLTYSSLELEDVKVRIYGDAAVLNCRQVSDAVYDDGERHHEMRDAFRATLVFANTGDTTSIVGIQFSPIAGSPS